MKVSRDIVLRAKALGCTSAELVTSASGRRFSVRCSCGYQSTTRNTRGDAFEALAHHLGKVARGLVVNGVSVPTSGKAPDAGTKTDVRG